MTLSRYSIFAFTLLYFMSSFSFLAAQDKKQMQHGDFKIWNTINNTLVSDDGNWVSYMVEPGEGDPSLVIYHVTKHDERTFQRASSAAFSHDSRFMVFSISPAVDTVRELRRKNVKEDELPGDSLAVYTLSTGQLTVIPGIKGFTVPEEWSGFLLYQAKEVSTATDTTSKKLKKPKNGDKKGYPLIVRNLESGAEDTIASVKSYKAAKSADQVILHSTGVDSLLAAGVYRYTCREKELIPLSTQKGTYEGLAIAKDGNQMAFLGDTDTSKVRVRPYSLFYFSPVMDSAHVVALSGDSWMPASWHVSKNTSPEFSENGRYLHFGTAPPPVLQDTSLLDEEIVEVEVWHSDDPVLYTQQNVRVKDEKKRTYLAVFNTGSREFLQVESPELKESSTDQKKNSPYVITYTLEPYAKESSWTGMRERDLYLKDLSSGNTSTIGKRIAGSARLSPSFNYVYWYNSPDSSWFAYSIDEGIARNITASLKNRVADELNDRPMYPGDYGIAGWLAGDEGILIYDRYDMWLVDPEGIRMPRNLTMGRREGMTFRYIRLDPEERFIDPKQTLLLHTFYHADKSSGYAELDLTTQGLKHLVKGQYRYDNRPQKSKHANTIVFTRESFRDFPDIRLTQDRFRSIKKISDANPQQAGYSWGDIEVYSWDDNGKKRTGLLVKPDGFDPTKKYPMIVNFYERSTDGLHTYRHPQPHRSTINYPFYTSRGYVIFNPDVAYEIGYPGKSAYEAVVSGTKALIGEGFVDEKRIGLQGHSWGGYQVAHIITKTDMFACAESGAPVVNMISAYGGIRWGSGMSRMFQYERTQSRLGATLWERPDLYIMNSPIFNADKINTPVLILHNDTDGAVPWYQGIEFFVAMRRLGKPAWMLNYNDEPHWPLKLRNRKDFNIRMQQFFDHYLKGAPLPLWMERGVPSIEKGILQGYELTGDQKSGGSSKGN